jgi:hypothetical protein
MKARRRHIHLGALAVALALTSGHAGAEQPAFPWMSREISPAPPRSMRRVSSAALFLVGLGLERSRAVSSSRDGWAITAGVSTIGVGNVEGLSTETALGAAIGGGPGGLVGLLDGRYLVGWRGYVTDWQGPFVRVGGETRAFGSFLPLLSVPDVVAGYEVIGRGLALDVGLHGAFALGAGYQIYSGASRDVSDSPVLGAYGWLIAHPVQVGLRWDRLWPHNDTSLGHDPIDDVRASACVATGRFVLVLCANLDMVSGPAPLSAGPALFQTTGFAQSISVGFGAIGASAEAPPRSR